MTAIKKTAPDALRTDRLLSVQNAMLTLINTLESQPTVERDETLHWERIHLASSARIAKDMAVKRGVNPELASIATALHDIGRIVTGKQKDHAHQGAEPARKLLEELNLFTEEEIVLLTQAVYNHTDKAIIGNEIEEIVKDADVVDCFEFGMELPREEQRARYRRYVEDHFGDLIASESSSDEKTSDPIRKALTLLKILGADSAKIIDPKQVVTAPWLKFKCQFDCDCYGKNPCCPPHTPDHAETRSILDSYTTAILFHRKSQCDMGAMAYKVMRQLFLDGYYKAAAFGSGDCQNPEKAAPSMEACGIDVMATAKNCGYDIHRVTDGEEFVNFFGLILVE